jgi:hypothetical protein
LAIVSRLGLDVGQLVFEEGERAMRKVVHGFEERF